MTVIYKVMSDKYVDDFISGKGVRVGTLSEFRDIEEQGLGDKNEAKYTVIQSEVSFTKGTEEERAQFIATLQNFPGMTYDGDPKDPWENVTFGGNMFVDQTSNYFIFCSSTTIDPLVVEKLKIDSLNFSGDPYNFVVPILETENFADKVWRSLGCPGWTQILYDPIAYENRFVDAAFEPGHDRADPFIKSPTFSDQKEFRILFNHVIDEKQKGVICSPSFDPGTFGDPFPLEEYEDHMKHYQGG